MWEGRRGVGQSVGVGVGMGGVVWRPATPPPPTHPTPHTRRSPPTFDTCHPAPRHRAPTRRPSTHCHHHPIPSLPFPFPQFSFHSCTHPTTPPTPDPTPAHCIIPVRLSRIPPLPSHTHFSHEPISFLMFPNIHPPSSTPHFTSSPQPQGGAELMTRWLQRESRPQIFRFGKKK